MSIPRQHIIAHAPVRICDLGGWTDTWFAGHGRICSLAVAPGVTVEITMAASTTPTDTITVEAVNYGRTMRYPDDMIEHPLLVAAIAELPPPIGATLTIRVAAQLPPGCATGTSAAVAVALLAGLAACHGNHPSAGELARLAHQLETDRLGLQSGIQDQIGAAYGGCNDITMSAYPTATVHSLRLSSQTVAQLNQQMVLFYLGKPHISSAIHQQVITRFESTPTAQQLLDPLRQIASAGGHAIANGDLVTFGLLMRQNTEAQRALHPMLISADVDDIITLATQHDALGWKVNGAGGDGGSLAVLCSASQSQRDAFVAVVQQHLPHVKAIPVQFSPNGVQVSIHPKEQLR
ncbi:MAG: GHMP kinase [Chloroflexales bacterium]|nr:GHMP kinase [Chloroflexales bacterium]